MNPNTKNHRDVLFQKLNNKWYVFAEGKDGPICTALPEGIDPRQKKWELYEILEQQLPQVALPPSPEKPAKPKKRLPEGRAA